SVPDVALCSGKPPHELEGDGKALMSIVECCDLQFREVKTLSEHVYTDNDPRFPRAQKLDCFTFFRIAVLAVDEQRIMSSGALFVDLINLFGTINGFDTGHHDVIKVFRQIEFQLFYGGLRNFPICSLGVIRSDGEEVYEFEISLLLRLAKRVVADNFAIHVF